jgi:hypothetical protein
MQDNLSQVNLLKVLVPPSLTLALRQAADRDMGSVSDFVRRTLLERLRTLGIDPMQLEKRSK